MATHFLSLGARSFSASALVSIAFGRRPKVGSTLSTLVSPWILSFDGHFGSKAFDQSLLRRNYCITGGCLVPQVDLQVEN